MILSRPQSHPEIRLRPASPRDAALLRRWREEESIRRFQPLNEMTLSQLRTELSKQRIAELYRNHGDKFQWIVLVDGLPAGWITLVILNWDHGLAEVGYTLATQYQRRGLMIPAMQILLRDLFQRTRLERIEARCATENLASQKVLHRLHFVREGHLRSYFRLHGERVDNYLFALLKEDFLERFAP
jgi:RimJ/RimL family protein N-acetyltransferase